MQASKGRQARAGSYEVAAQIPENLLAEDLAEYKKAVEILQAMNTEIEARLAKLSPQ